jgi:dihydrodipicolinate synthase/N-acetylneuraminate lyase
MTLHGTIAAVVTPLRDGGARVDQGAIEPLAGLVAAGGCDGVLVAGTTGEGILLAPAERRALAEAWIAAAPSGLDVAVHVGAQTTADTVALAEHVAVIGPPYFALDDDELHAHFDAAIAACAPTPAYLYEFRDRTGYAVAPAVVGRLRDAHPSLSGMKVSDRTFAELQPYLGFGLDAFVGAEPLIPQAMAAGAAGSVSGLATAFPELVAAAVADPSPEAGERLAAIRSALSGAPTIAGLKRVLQRRGLAIQTDVRAPLRGLTDDERRAVDEAADRFLSTPV